MASARTWDENRPLLICKRTASIALPVDGVSEYEVPECYYQTTTEKNGTNCSQFLEEQLSTCNFVVYIFFCLANQPAASTLPATSFNGGFLAENNLPLMSTRKLKPFSASRGNLAKFSA